GEGCGEFDSVQRRETRLLIASGARRPSAIPRRGRPARWGGSTDGRINLGVVDVIVTHVSTDFDAFASMLAARRLYPDACVALSGSLNRNVREFYRLHADELDVVEPGRLDPEAIERLIVVETVHADRLGEFEA